MTEKDLEKKVNKKMIIIAAVRNTLITVLCIAVGVVIAVYYMSYQKEDLNDDTLEQVNKLQERVIDLIQESEKLKDEKEALSEELDKLNSKENRDKLQALIDELANIKTFAGMTKVTGKGMCITVSFPVSFSYSSIQSYLTLTINDLRASNAQAISINGERIMSMSEVRVSSKGQIAVNGRIITAPYEIHAIGDSSSLQSGMFLGGEGIIPIMQSKGATVEWQIKNDIVIEACRTEDFKMDLLTPIE